MLNLSTKYHNRKNIICASLSGKTFHPYVSESCIPRTNIVCCKRYEEIDEGYPCCDFTNTTISTYFHKHSLVKCICYSTHISALDLLWPLHGQDEVNDIAHGQQGPLRITFIHCRRLSKLLSNVISDQDSIFYIDFMNVTMLPFD